MPHALLRIIKKPAFKIGVSLLAIMLLLYFLPLPELLDSLRRISAGVWLLVTLSYLLLHFFGAIKWQILINTTPKKIPLSLAVRFYSAGLFSNLFLPSLVGGDVVKAGLAIQHSSEKGAVIIGTFLDRLIDTSVIVLIIIVAGFYAPDFLNPGDQKVVYTILFVLLLVLITAFLLISIPAQWMGVKSIAKIVEKVQKSVLRAMKSPGRTLLALLLSGIIQCGLIILSIILAEGIYIEQPISIWFLIWPLTKLSTLLPISLGGMGVREVVLAVLLSRVDVAATQSVALGLLWETVIIIGGLSCGAIYFLSNRFSKNKMMSIRNASKTLGKIDKTD